MKYKLIILAFLILILFFPTILGWIAQTLIWIFSLKYQGATISLLGDIILRIIGPILSTSIVSLIHVKNKKIRGLTLSLFDIIISFLLSYLIMIVQTYDYIIFGLFFLFLICNLGIFIIKEIKEVK